MTSVAIFLFFTGFILFGICIFVVMIRLLQDIYKDSPIFAIFATVTGFCLLISMFLFIIYPPIS